MTMMMMMHLPILMVVVCVMLRPCLVVSQAGHHDNDNDNHRWKSPGPKDRRGPCPGLNALANHGYLFRNGTDIAFDDIAAAAEENFGFLAEFLYTAGIIPMVDQFLGKTRSWDGARSISLDDLYRDPVESDASHVHRDEGFGFQKSKKVDCGLLNQLFSTTESKILTVQDFANHRRTRILDSRCFNPEYTNFTIPTREVRLTVNSMNNLLLLMMGSTGDLATVSKENLYEFLVLQRFPKEYKPRQELGLPLVSSENSDDVLDFFSGVSTEAIDEEVNCNGLVPTVTCTTNKRGKKICKSSLKGDRRYRKGKLKGYCKFPRTRAWKLWTNRTGGVRR